MTLTSQNSDTIMNDLKLRFGTNTNTIDANTLINSIMHFTNLVQEVNRELKTDRKIEVKVVALEPGSFVVNILIESGVIDTITNLFTKENIAIAAGVVNVVKGVFDVAKFFKGDKPKKVENINDSIKIENMEGNSKIIDNRVYNIYNGPIVQQIIAKEFETLNNDDEVQSFEIIDKSDDSTIEFQKNEFSDISNIEYIPDTAKRNLPKTAILSIITLSFDRKKKWDFMYDGHKISAKIQDDIFYTLIDGGESFAKGDKLKVELEITQVFNELANAYGNHSYKVTKIIEHTNGTDKSQLPMF